MFEEILREFLIPEREQTKDTGYYQIATITDFNDTYFSILLGNGESGLIPLEEISIYENDIPEGFVNKKINCKKIPGINNLYSRKAVQEYFLNNCKIDNTFIRAHIIGFSENNVFIDIGCGIKSYINIRNLCRTRVRSVKDYFMYSQFKYEDKIDVFVSKKLTENYSVELNTGKNSFFASHIMGVSRENLNLEKNSLIYGTVRDPFIYGNNIGNNMISYMIEINPQICGIIDSYIPLIYGSNHLFKINSFRIDKKGEYRVHLSLVK